MQAIISECKDYGKNSNMSILVSSMDWLVVGKEEMGSDCDTASPIGSEQSFTSVSAVCLLRPMLAGLWS